MTKLAANEPAHWADCASNQALPCDCGYYDRAERKMAECFGPPSTEQARVMDKYADLHNVWEPLQRNDGKRR